MKYCICFLFLILSAFNVNGQNSFEKGFSSELPIKDIQFLDSNSYFWIGRVWDENTDYNDIGYKEKIYFNTGEEFSLVKNESVISTNSASFLTQRTDLEEYSTIVTKYILLKGNKIAKEKTLIFPTAECQVFPVFVDEVTTKVVISNLYSKYYLYSEELVEEMKYRPFDGNFKNSLLSIYNDKVLISSTESKNQYKIRLSIIDFKKIEVCSDFYKEEEGCTLYASFLFNNQILLSLKNDNLPSARIICIDKGGKFKWRNETQYPIRKIKANLVGGEIYCKVSSRSISVFDMYEGNIKSVIDVNDYYNFDTSLKKSAIVISDFQTNSIGQLELIIATKAIRGKRIIYNNVQHLIPQESRLEEITNSCTTAYPLFPSFIIEKDVYGINIGREFIIRKK